MRNEGRAAADAILRFRVPRALREAAEAAAALEGLYLRRCASGFATRPARRTPAVLIRQGSRHT
jgi:hypothetical protein